MAGVDARRQVALDAMDADGGFLSERARLWPQTEWMNAAFTLADISHDDERNRRLSEAWSAARALRYLTDDGVWRDKL